MAALKWPKATPFRATSLAQGHLLKSASHYDQAQREVPTDPVRSRSLHSRILGSTCGSCIGGRSRRLGSIAAKVILLAVVAIPLRGWLVGRRMLGQILELCQRFVGTRRVQVNIHKPPSVRELVRG